MCKNWGTIRMWIGIVSLMPIRIRIWIGIKVEIRIEIGIKSSVADPDPVPF